MTKDDFKAQMVLNFLEKKCIDYSKLVEMDEGEAIWLNSDGMAIVDDAIDFAKHVLSYLEDRYRIVLE